MIHRGKDLYARLRRSRLKSMMDSMSFPVMRLLITVLVLLSILSTSSCQSQPTTFLCILELDAQEMSLEEASIIVGRPVPRPTYLHDDFEIREIYVRYDPDGVTYSTVIFLISNEEIQKELVSHTDAAGNRQRYECRCKMEMLVSWHKEGIPGGLKLPGEKVRIGETNGKLLDKGDYYTVWWQQRPDPSQAGMFNIYLSASKGISKTELMEVAEGVTK